MEKLEAKPFPLCMLAVDLQEQPILLAHSGGCESDGGSKIGGGSFAGDEWRKGVEEDSERGCYWGISRRSGSPSYEGSTQRGHVNIIYLFVL